MNTPALLSGLGLAAIAVYLFRLAKQDMGIRKELKGLTPIRIRNIQPGLCLVEGTVESQETLSTPYGQLPSVWFHYEAFERRTRQDSSRMYDHSLGSGEQSRPFILKENSHSIPLMPDGGRMSTYPHKRLFKSESGTRTGMGDRIKKLKEMDQNRYPEGGKKPFFRKLEVNAPLDIPDDLVELAMGSGEAERAHRKYFESWVQSGDRMFILGTAAMAPDGSGLRIMKAGRSPLLLSSDPKDLTAKAFQRTMLMGLLVGAGSAALGIFLIMIGLGAG